MHNVGATQALGKRVETLKKDLAELANDDLRKLYNQLKGELSALSDTTADSARVVSDKIAEVRFVRQLSPYNALTLTILFSVSAR